MGVFLIVKFPLRHQKNKKNADGVWVLFGGTSLLSSSPSVKYRVREDVRMIETKIDKIPLFLRRIKGWAGYKLKETGKKPLSVLDMKGVGPDDKDRVVDFDTITTAFQSGEVDAVGVSLSGEEITCVDLDCHDPALREKYEELKEEILGMFHTYAETSISGLGVHIYVKGKKPEGYKHCDKWGIIEVYDCSRFMIVTGNVVDEAHDTYLAVCQEQLNALCEKYLLKKGTYSGLVGKGVYTKTDEEVIGKLKKFKKGLLFWEGRWVEIQKKDDAGYEYQAYPSQSEADFAFASLLLFLNGNNPEQAEKIFLQSGMWSEKRKAKKASGYVQHTIGEASIRCSRVYDWDRLSYTPVEQNLDVDEVLQQNQGKELIAKAKSRKLVLSNNPELNEHLCKYIINYGSESRDVPVTVHGDLDSAANGIRFWLVNQNDLIYLSDGDEWLAWNGKVWDRCYDKNLLWYAERVFHQLKYEAYNLFRESVVQTENQKVLEKQALTLFEYASSSKGKRQCMEMIEFSKSHFIKAQKEQKVGQKITANSNVLNLQNGVFNFDDLNFYPHSREFYQTKMAGVAYEEGAECLLWVDFLNTVLPSEPVRRFLQKAIGYTLSSGYMEKCMFVLYGENGNNGKTTIIKTIHTLMGEYAVAAEKQTIMDVRSQSAGSPRPDLVRLRDRRFVCISESEKDDKLAEGLIKNLTGGGIVICRTLHHEPVEFKSTFKIFLDTNYKPQVRGTDEALWRRLKVIPFEVTIPPEKIDLNFGEKLEQELPGILNWAIEGYKLYKAEGLGMPEEMSDIIKDYAEDMSSLDQWLKECVIQITDAGKNSISYTSKQLYQSYQHWCKFNGEYSWTQRKFTQEINRKPAFQEIKKVQGYIRYRNVTLNDIGDLCYHKAEFDDSDFAKKYHEKVALKFERSEKEQADS